jgi:hypothetical protein
MSFLSGYANIFSHEDERARQDREQKQRQRLALQDAAHFRQQAEQITLPFQAEVFRREADAKIKGLELRLNQDKAKKEGMEFRQFADQTVAKKLGGLFGGDSELRSRRQEAEAARNQSALNLNVTQQGGSGYYQGNERLIRPTVPPDLSDTGQAFGSGLVPGMVQRSGIQSTPEEVRRLQAYPPEVAAGLIEQGNIGPVTDIGSPHYGAEGAPLPIVGDIPGFRTLPEAAATIGTAGLGSGGALMKLGMLGGGTGGGYAGREVAGTPGEIIGTLGGALVGGAVAPKIGRALTEAVQARPGGLMNEAGGTRLPHSFGPGDEVYIRGTSGEVVASGVIKGVEGNEAVIETIKGTTRHPIANLDLFKPAYKPTVAQAEAAAREAGGQTQRADPVTKMTDWMNEQADALKASRAGRRAQVAELHGRQASILQDVYRNPDLTPQQQLETGLQRLPEAGTAGRADFTPPPISETETGELFAKIRDYPLFQNRRFKALNAQKGLASLMMGDLPGQYELGLLEQVFGPEFVRATAKQSGSKWRQLAVAAGLPRTVRTILDVSWTLRQGAGVLPRHPKEVLGNAPRGVRAFFSENVAQQWDEATRMKGGLKEIVGDDGVPKTWTIAELQDEAGLFLPRIDQEVAPLAERTEEFMATQGGDTWVGKLFGKGVLGFPIRASQRSFVTVGNATRSDMFENTITGRLFNLGKPVTMEDARGLAWLINVGTGRGDLSELNRYAALLSTPIFSPRLFAARIEHGLSPAILATGAGGAPRSAKAAALAAQQLVAFVGTGVALAAAASQVPGVRSEANALSTKFGKLELGFDPLNPLKDTTKIDLFGGYQQYARTIAQLYSAKAKSDTGEIYEKDRQRVLLQFLRGKVSPNLGTVLDVINGETAVGDKVDLKTAAGVRTFLWNEFSPLSFNDIVEAVNRDDGFRPEYGLLAPISASGGGVQTYGGRPSSVIYSMPYYEGMDAKSEQELRDFMDEASYEYQRAKAAGADISQADVARVLGKETGRAGLGEAAAKALQGDLPLNRERIQFAIDHQDELEAKTLLGAVPDAILREYLTPENFERVFKR